MDKELMDDVIRLNDFLDSVFGVMRKVAFFAIGFGLGALALVVPLWPLVSQQPALFAIAGLLLLLAGGLAGAAITLVATRGRTRRQIEARDRVIDAMGTEIDELGKRPTQEKVDDLNRQLSARDAEIAELEKRPTQREVDGLRQQLSARDAEIVSLRSARALTPLEILKARLGEDGVSAFRSLCAASTYADGRPARPLVFDLDDAKLKAVGLTARMVQHMADVGAIRLVASDERELVGSDACPEMVDLGDGVSASASTVRFSLAGGECVEVGPVRMSWGTDVFIVDGRLSGADLGIASFTEEGAELAAECAAAKPPFGMGGYIEKAYSEEMRVSRNRFRCLTEDGDLVAR